MEIFHYPLSSIYLSILWRAGISSLLRNIPDFLCAYVRKSNTFSYFTPFTQMVYSIFTLLFKKTNNIPRDLSKSSFNFFLQLYNSLPCKIY